MLFSVSSELGIAKGGWLIVCLTWLPRETTLFHLLVVETSLSRPLMFERHLNHHIHHN